MLIALSAAMHPNAWQLIKWHVVQGANQSQLQNSPQAQQSISGILPTMLAAPYILSLLGHVLPCWPAHGGQNRIFY